MTRRTKIVATIGPASDSPDQLRALIEAGVDVVRLNLSHGALADHVERLARVRDVAVEVGRHVAVLADLPGPKIRAGRFPDHGAELVTDSLVVLRPGISDSDADVIHVVYPTLLDDLVVGAQVQLGDGAISMCVIEIGPDGAVARVEAGGHASGEPGVHLPSETIRLATPTDEDLELAEAMASEGVEFIAVSFVREGRDLAAVRRVVGDRALLVAKIETRAAVECLDDVVAASDAVMVARGDLGIECPIEDVPHLQKQIVRHCVEVGVPVITATQMLESMITAPSPTRAEVSDVANAVFDGTDAVMLSGETAIGRDPVRVVRTMSTIAERAESEASYRQWANRLGRTQRERDWGGADRADPITAALTHAASEAARDVDAAAILCCTQSGRTATAMARFRPDARLVGLSPHESTVRSLALSWGVEPLRVDIYGMSDEVAGLAVQTALDNNFIGPGDTVLVLAGATTASGVATDVMRIVKVP